jgi:hypothetical protein
VAEAEELPDPDEIDERKLALERMKLERMMATEQSESRDMFFFLFMLM